MTGADIDDDRPKPFDNFGNFNAPLAGFGGFTSTSVLQEASLGVLASDIDLGPSDYGPGPG